MNSASPLIVEREGAVLRLTLARPNRRNALSRALVEALAETISRIDGSEPERVVVLAGNGPIFCAGADLTEFAEAGDPQRLRDDADRLIGLLGAIAGCPLPVVAAVHGAAYGGGLGLVCAADLAIAASGTQFSLSETRLGLVPAVIGPYVVAALGPREARARMMLAAPFGVEDALRIGLIHRTTTADGLATAVDETIADLLQSPPGALAAAKGLVRTVVNRTPDETRDQMGALLAERRASDEGQEGMAAFLEKRRPSWVPPQSDTP